MREGIWKIHSRQLYQIYFKRIANSNALEYQMAYRFGLWTFQRRMWLPVDSINVVHVLYVFMISAA